MSIRKSLLIGSLAFAATMALSGCEVWNNVTNHSQIMPRMATKATLPHHLHLQEAKLLHKLESDGTKVVHENHRVRMIMAKQSNFRTASAVVNRHFKQRLDLVARIMNANPYTIGEIQGNADSRGSVRYNQRLSERRAHAVIAYLESQGVPSSRLVAKGFSELKPRSSNGHAHGRRKNRRVEITLHESHGRHDSYNFDPTA